MSRRIGLALGLLTLATVLRGIVWIGLLPPWQGPDEPSHYAFVERLANWSYPNKGDPRDHASAALEASIEHSAFSYFLVHDERRPFTVGLRRELPPEPPGLSQSAPGSLTTDNYPPLYYAALVPFFRLPGLHTATSRLYALRFGSAILGGVLVVLTFFLIRELVPDDVVALAGAALIGLPPMMSQASAICNPDIGLAVACTGLALAALRVARRGVTARRVMAVAVLAAAAALTKPFGIVAAASLGIPLLAVPLLSRRTHRPLLATAVVAIAGAAGVLLVGLERYGLLVATNVRFFVDYLWQFYLPRLPGRSDVFPSGFPLTDPVPAWSIWGATGVGSFGWLSARLRIQFVELGVLTIASAIVMAVVACVLGRRSSPRWNGVFVGSCAVAVLVYVVGLHVAEAINMLQARGSAQPLQGRILQGRYLIPAAPLALTAVIAAVHAWSRRATVAMLAVLLVVWFGISIAAVNTVLAFYAT